MVNPPPIETRDVGRPDHIMTLNLSLNRDAVKVLREHAPNQKSYGKFLSNLLFEYDRQQGFKTYFEQEAKRQLAKLCNLVRQGARQGDGA